MLSLSRKLSCLQVICSYARELLQTGCGVLILALSSNLSIPLPNTPIPFTLAPQIALALGVLMGKSRGVFTTSLYLISGTIGLPIFALQGSGILHLLGPRGGYLIGYVVATYVVGYLFESRKKLTPFLLFSWLSLGNGLIYLFGVFRLSAWTGLESAFCLGVLPFLLGDLSKLLILHTLLNRLPFIQNKTVISGENRP